MKRNDQSPQLPQVAESLAFLNLSAALRIINSKPCLLAMIMNLTEGCNFAILKGLTVEKKVVFSYLKMILKGEEQWN
ncbi:MAG: hypothetical protein IKO03_04980 [Lachnospiraceae bacterium]|nr:hypothetical protein [Lachnospiraceae bacterium]